MKSVFVLACLLLACSFVMAEEFEINRNETSSADGARDIGYWIENYSCNLKFEIHYFNKAKSQSIAFLDKFENCKSGVPYTYKIRAYESMLNKIFSEGVFDNENAIKIYWGTTEYSPELGCRLMRFSSTSDDWRTLSNKFDNRRVEFAEQNPFPGELGAFIRRSGVLAEIDSVFQKHGFQLTSVNVGGFSSRPIGEAEKQLDCPVRGSLVQIVPTGAELYLLFERFRPVPSN